MSKYLAQIHWKRATSENYIDNKYSRGHEWRFDGGITVQASSSPHIVPLPYSIEENVDPEEAFIASLSSCHMLFFLSIAAKQKFVINSYQDDTVGIMEKNQQGKIAMTQIILNPYIQFHGDQPSIDELEKMHHEAHEQCFLANSVTTEIITNIVLDKK